MEPIPLSTLVGDPAAFPILGRWDFFNHAGVCPLPAVAAEALREYARQAAEEAYLAPGYYRRLDALRAAAARMINADKEEVAFVKNTSEGIATVAAGIEWRPGDRVVTTAVEYPANMYPWIDASRRFGAELITVPEEPFGGGSARAVPLESILAAADHPRTRLLTLSHVEYGTGQRHDLAAVGRFCRDRGVLFCVDAIQSMGVLPIDVRAMNIDFLSADGHKWLLGPEGAGVFFCRRDLLAGMHPLIVGWMNVVNDQDYETYDFTLKPDARRFECGTHNLPGLWALGAAVDLLLGVGVDAVAARLKTVTDRLVAGLVSKGYEVASPRAGESWSGIVSFISPRAATSPAHDPMQIWRMLRKEHHTEVAVRARRLRASPHFYNTEEQIDRLLDRLPGH